MELPKLKIRRPSSGLLYGLFFLIAAFCITEYQKKQEPTQVAPTPAAAGETWTGALVQVKDGDSLVLRRGQEEVEIRLYGLDAPELGQEYGAEAKAALEKTLAGREVTVKGREHDEYGRLVAELILPDGREVGSIMAGEGWAWVYRHYCQDAFCSDWLDLEAKARVDRKGLWAGAQPENPRDWRTRRQQNQKTGQ